MNIRNEFFYIIERMVDRYQVLSLKINYPQLRDQTDSLNKLKKERWEVIKKIKEILNKN